MNNNTIPAQVQPPPSPPPIYNNGGYYSVQSEPYNKTKIDVVFGYLGIVCSFILVNFWLFGGGPSGVATTAALLLLLFVTVAYLIKSGVKLTVESLVFLAVLIASASYYSFFLGVVPSVINFLFFTVMYIYFIVTATGNRLENKIGAYTIVDLFKNIFIVAFSNFLAIFKKRDDAESKETSKGSKTLLHIILGVALAFPLLLVVIALLQNADETFSKLTEKIMSTFFERIGLYILQLFLCLPVAIYFFALIFGNIKKRKTQILTKENAKNASDACKIVPTGVIYGALSSFILIYLLFFITQLGYLSGGFAKILPGEFTMAEYARRGFFELCLVAGINLLIIICVYFFTKIGDGKAPVFFKICNTLLSFFTLFFIGVAISKMFLYIERFGLTQMRLYTSYFMIFIGIVFALVIIKQFAAKFNVMQAALIAAVAMVILFCFADTDVQIAKYNTYRQLQNSESSGYLDYMRDLSNGAVPYIEEIYQKTDNTEIKEQALELLRGKQTYELTHIERRTWKNFNFSNENAVRILDKYDPFSPPTDSVYEIYD